MVVEWSVNALKLQAELYVDGHFSRNRVRSFNTLSKVPASKTKLSEWTGQRREW